MRRSLLGMLFFVIACGPFFYQAPPSLGTYPERLPVKRWPDLFKEAAPLDPALPAAAAMDERCAALPHLLARLNRAGRLAAIDGLLKENRDGAYDGERANKLHELRELAADDATFAAAEAYLAWRVQRTAWLPTRAPASKPWNMTDEEFAALRDERAQRMKQETDEFEHRLAKSPPALLPNWKVQRGASLFRAGRQADAAAEFSAVIEGYPAHPRAEAARLMLARCRVEEARALECKEVTPEIRTQIQELREQAEPLLQEFIKLYPNGRFTPDAHGWLAAIASDRGRLGAAVAHQLDRLDLQPTREITRTVMRECDQLFERLLTEPNEDREAGWLDPVADFDAAKVARHPVIARLFVQHAIDPAAGEELPPLDRNCSGDRWTIDFLKHRIFTPKPLIHLALGALGREMIRAGTGADGITLTLLAWSATEAGEHEQALALLDRIIDPKPGDEALQARAIVLQRLERHAEAVAAFDRLVTVYPDSPLANDVPFRRALSQFRAGAVGEAIVGLHGLVAKDLARQQQEQDPDAPVAEEPLPNLHPEHHLIQWLDTLVQFAPLDALASALAALPADAPQAANLRDTLRTRALAAHDFALAKRYLTTEPAAERPEWLGRRYLFSEAQRLDAGAWEARVAPLAKLYADLAAEQRPAAQAQLHLALARHWLEQRGWLTLPSLGIYYYANSEEERQDLLRRQNALQLGFSRDVIHAELDRRDEASQALEHALAAAASDESAIAAPALELANLCLFRRAEFSLYQKSRALETNASQLSRGLYTQLRQRFPKSPEARRAIYHVFAPAAGPWMPGDYNRANSAMAIVAALDGRQLGEYVSWDDAPIKEHAEALAKITALPAALENPKPGTTLAGMRRELLAAKRALDALRPLTLPTWQQEEVVAVIDRLDDLAAAAALPDIGMVDFTNYVTRRDADLPQAFKSLLDFRGRLKPHVDPDGNEQGPENDTIAGWRGFLEIHPESPKAEAASFRLTRLLARQYRARISVEAFHFPAAPIPNGYKRIGVERPDPDHDPKAVLAAIAEHETRYSTGRYQDDLDLLRAGALIDAGDYSKALVLLERILANPVQRDLHVVAALDFCEVALNLLEPEQRMKVVAALRQAPGALRCLRRLVAGDTCLARLEPLMPWLEEAARR